jgi:hypothetical protein
MQDYWLQSVTSWQRRVDAGDFGRLNVAAHPTSGTVEAVQDDFLAEAI